MTEQETRRRLEQEAAEAEHAWRVWLLAMFGSETDARYQQTVKLLEAKIATADALAGHLVAQLMQTQGSH